MSRLDRLREIARTSHFPHERATAKRLADRLSGQRSDRARKAAAFINDVMGLEGDQRWRETADGWESMPAPNGWGIEPLPIRRSDDQVIEEAVFIGGGDFA